MDVFIHMLTKSKYFEDVDEYSHDPKWERQVHTIYGNDVDIWRKSFWTFVNIHKNLPQQGFKIHISPDFSKIEKQFVDVVNILKRYNASYKYIADMSLLVLGNSRHFSRPASGKFFTIYPKDMVEFHLIADALKEALYGYNGPYILSDRRVPGSRVVYYRYGGFRVVKGFNQYGEQINVISSPDGSLIEDKREAKFSLPEGINDPYHAPASSTIRTENSGTKICNYLIKTVIKHSNTGGVYVGIATSHGTNEHKYVIKEARPCTGMRKLRDGEIIDAIASLKHEYEVLIGLEHLGYTPEPHKYFMHWEHAYLVQEHLDMITWQQFFLLEENSLAPYMRDPKKAQAFLKIYLPLVKNAIEMVEHIHAAGYAMGDISSSNLMIDKITLKVRYVDVESFCHDNEPHWAWERGWGTPGFVNYGKVETERLSRVDDWYSLACCMFLAITPMQHILACQPLVLTRDLSFSIIDDLGLPIELSEFLNLLADGDVFGSKKELSKIGNAQQLSSRPKKREINETWANSAKDAFEKVKQGLIVSYKGLAGDLLWPACPEAFTSNRWCIAYGALGIIPLCPSVANDEFYGALNKDLIYDQIPIGLFNGLSGIAYHLASSGRSSDAVNILKALSSHPARYRNANVIGGEAGVAIASMSIYRLTNDTAALECARESIEYICKSAIELKDGVYWEGGRSRLKDEGAYYGYGRGAAGIAFVLSQYSHITGRAEFLQLGKRAINFVMDRARRNKQGALVWGRDKLDPRLLPFWMDGTAGIASVLLRIGLQTSNKKLLDDAKSALVGAFSAQMSQCGQFNGLSGIGDSLLDFYITAQVNKEKETINQMICGLIKGLMPFLHNVEGDGVCTPGDYNLRLCADFATGSAGVGMFLHRLINKGPRTFLDFNLPSKHFFGVMGAP